MFFAFIPSFSSQNPSSSIYSNPQPSHPIHHLLFFFLLVVILIFFSHCLSLCLSPSIAFPLLKSLLSLKICTIPFHSSIPITRRCPLLQASLPFIILPPPSHTKGGLDTFLCVFFFGARLCVWCLPRLRAAAILQHPQRQDRRHHILLIR